MISGWNWFAPLWPGSITTTLWVIVPPIPAGCAVDDDVELVGADVGLDDEWVVLGAVVVWVVVAALGWLEVVGVSDVVVYVVGSRLLLGVVMVCEPLDAGATVIFGGTVMVVLVGLLVELLVDLVIEAPLADFGVEVVAAELVEAVPRPGTVTAGALLGAATDAGLLDVEPAAEDAVELAGSAVVAVPQAARPSKATQSRTDGRTDRRARMGPECQ